MSDPHAGIDLALEEQDARKPFAGGVERLVTALAERVPSESRRHRAATLRRLATLAGAIVIVRAVDGKLAANVLAACRSAESNEE